jgi:hypothetical protein
MYYCHDRTNVTLPARRQGNLLLPRYMQHHGTQLTGY